MEINFTILILRLHQEGLTEILQLASNFQQKMDSISQAAIKGQPGDRIASAGPPLTTIEEVDEDGEDVIVIKTPVVKSKKWGLNTKFESEILRKKHIFSRTKKIGRRRGKHQSEIDR